MAKDSKSKVTAPAPLPVSTGFWLVKSEPDVYGVADLKRDGRTMWEGVRNYQARNYLRAMIKGDRVLFYHSSAETVGIAGVAVVRSAAQPDPTQFDARGDYFDPAATKSQPRWFAAELGFERQFARIITPDEMRGVKALAGMVILRRGNRLSVTPVQPAEFQAVLGLAGARTAK